MSEFINFIPIEAESKRKHSPYEVRDIRVSILEELVIVMCLVNLTINDYNAGWTFATVLWVVTLLLSTILCVKIWKRNRKNV